MSRLDPRLLQIACLSSLIGVGVYFYGVDVRFDNSCVVVATALVCQFIGGRFCGQRMIGYQSALISALSLSLLMRTTSLWCAASVAMVTIGSKFVLRYKGKHIFNPTNFGLAAATLLGAPVWISPGQWGSGFLFGAAVACCGTVVVSRAFRADVTVAFLGSYAAVLVWRALSLGDPLAIPLHQIANGGTLIFAFFMISDPRTTPDSRVGRILFAGAVAYLAYSIRFTWYTPNAVIWALFFLSPLVPLLDVICGGDRFVWPRTESSSGLPLENVAVTG